MTVRQQQTRRQIDWIPSYQRIKNNWIVYNTTDQPNSTGEVWHPPAHESRARSLNNRAMPSTYQAMTRCSPAPHSRCTCSKRGLCVTSTVIQAMQKLGHRRRRRIRLYAANKYKAQSCDPTVATAPNKMRQPKSTTADVTSRILDT